MSEFTDMLVRQISLFGITDLIDICVVAYVMFQLIKLLRETRAIQLVKGLLHWWLSIWQLTSSSCGASAS